MKKRKWSLTLFICILCVLLSSASVLAADNEVTIRGGTKRNKALDVSYGTNYVDSLTKTQQMNWYKLTSTGKEGFYTIWMKNYNIDSAITAVIYKGNSPDPILTMKNKKTKEKKADIKLSPNSVYYIRITNAVTTTTGMYGFNVSFREDGEPDQQKNAMEIREGQKVAGGCDGYDDVDWFRFVAPESGTYLILMRRTELSDGEACGYVYNKKAKQLSYMFQFGSSDYTYKLKRGETYYIEIVTEGNTGTTSYVLQILNQTKLTDLTLNRTGTVKVKRGKTLVADVKSVAPTNASKGVTWKSSAPRIASVDGNGKIKGVGIGTASITAASDVTETITASFKVSVIPETPVITAVKSEKTKTAVLTWKKIIGTKFEIYRAESKNGKYTRIKTVAAGKMTYTDKTVKGKKRYYYRLVAYMKKGSVRYASAYSKVVSVKTK